jgi:hypothetical protein
MTPVEIAADDSTSTARVRRSAVSKKWHGGLVLVESLLNDYIATKKPWHIKPK